MSGKESIVMIGVPFLELTVVCTVAKLLKIDSALYGGIKIVDENLPKVDVVDEQLD